MQVDLPPDVFNRVRQRTEASAGVSEADVIRQALDTLDHVEIEQAAIESAAIQAGIDDWKAGNVQPFREFDREFRTKHGIPIE